MASRPEFQMCGVFLSIHLNSGSYKSNTIPSADRLAHDRGTVSGTLVWPDVLKLGGSSRLRAAGEYSARFTAVNLWSPGV